MNYAKYVGSSCFNNEKRVLDTYTQGGNGLLGGG